MRSDTSATDRQRKAWLRFDLSNDSINFSTVSSVQLELTVAEQPSSSSCGRTLTVYAMPTSVSWPSTLTWSSGPSNNTSSAWAFNSATQLGTYSLPCQEAVGSKITVNLSASYFKNDSDKKVILGMSFGKDTAGSSLKVHESGTSGPKIKVTY